MWSATPEMRVCTSAPPSPRRHHFAGGGLHQRRAAEEDRALFAHDDGLVAHRRHVGAAGGAAAHHAGDLRNALRRQVGLVVEDAAEVVAVGEDLVLQRQERAAGIDQVDARQVVLLGDLLRAQVLLHRHRVVGAALDRGVVGHDHAFHAAHPADAGHHAGGGHGVVVHAVRGQRRDFQEGAAGVEQGVDAVAQQLAARGVLGARGLAAAQRGAGEGGMQVVDHGLHGRAVGFQTFRCPVAAGCSGRSSRWPYRVRWNSSRPISMRRISEVPAPISYSLASRHKRPVGYSLM
jgi:hypothetical protein